MHDTYVYKFKKFYFLKKQV